MSVGYLDVDQKQKKKAGNLVQVPQLAASLLQTFTCTNGAVERFKCRFCGRLCWTSSALATQWYYVLPAFQMTLITADIAWFINKRSTCSDRLHLTPEGLWEKLLLTVAQILSRCQVLFLQSCVLSVKRQIICRVLFRTNINGLGNLIPNFFNYFFCWSRFVSADIKLHIMQRIHYAKDRANLSGGAHLPCACRQQSCFGFFFPRRTLTRPQISTF